MPKSIIQLHAKNIDYSSYCMRPNISLFSKIVSNTIMDTIPIGFHKERALILKIIHSVKQFAYLYIGHEMPTSKSVTNC